MKLILSIFITVLLLFVLPWLIQKLRIFLWTKRELSGYLEYRKRDLLIKLKDPLAIRLSISALRNKDSSRRQAATYLLEKIGSVRAVEPLLTALNDESTWVRKGAVGALGSIGDGRAIEPLICALTHSEDRRSVIEALDRIDHDWAKRDSAKLAVPRLIEELQEQLKRGNTQFCEPVARALESINSPECRKPLEEYYENEKRRKQLAEESSQARRAEVERLGPFPDLGIVVGKCASCARHVYPNSGFASSQLMMKGEVDKLQSLATSCPKCNAIYCTGCAHRANRQCRNCRIDVVGLRDKPLAINSSVPEQLPASSGAPSAAKRDIAPANPFSLGVQLLHHAIVTGDREQVKIFVELNPGNANAKHEDGSGTALHRATSCGDDAMVAELLAHGADPNARDDDGHTPLHKTAFGIGGTFDRGGKSRIVELLIAAGADINARGSRGETATDYANRQANAVEVLAALERADAERK